MFEKEIGKVLREILLENDHLSIYWNGVSTGSFTHQGSYQEAWTYDFAKPIAGNIERADYGNYGVGDIRICGFKYSQMVTNGLGTSILKRDRNSGSDRTEFSRFVYNSRLQNVTSTLQRSGINVCKSVKLKGYTLGFKDIKKMLISNVVGKTHLRPNEIFNEFYYIGSKNVLVGFTTVDSILYLRTEVLLKLIDDKPTLKQVLTNVLNCYYLVDDKSSKANIRCVEKDLVESISGAMLNQVMNGIAAKSNYSGYGSAETPISEQDLEKSIIIKVKDIVTNALSGTVFGIKDTYSYSKILEEILQTNKKKEGNIFQTGFAAGMQIGLKLEMLGWHPTSSKIISSESASIWWEKEITIIPEIFIYSGEKYLIPPEKRQYKITKLYINQNGKMHCEGNHPNVQNGKVCMGDLEINYSDKSSVLSEVLSRAERLLEVINYDSAYNNSEREKMLVYSKKLELFAKDDEKKKKKSSTTIKEVTFSDSDEMVEDVEEETVTPVMNPTVTSLDDDISIRTNNNTVPVPHLISETDESEIPFLSNVPTYIVPELDPMIVQSVNDEGVISPLIFIASSAAEIPVVATYSHFEEVSIGDADLL